MAITKETAVILLIRVPIGNLTGNAIQERLAHIKEIIKVDREDVEAIFIITRHDKDPSIEVVPLKQLIDGSAEPALTEEEFEEFRRQLAGALACKAS